jgi:hypothetical protein
VFRLLTAMTMVLSRDTAYDLKQASLCQIPATRSHFFARERCLHRLALDPTVRKMGASIG